MTSWVVAPLWNARSSSGGNCACTAFTNGIVNTPDKAVPAPSASGCNDPGGIAATAAASPGGANPADASACANAASVCSIAASSAGSAKVARIASVANSGPNREESSADNVITNPIGGGACRLALP